jgi:hypothetical protein
VLSVWFCVGCSRNIVGDHDFSGTWSLIEEQENNQCPSELRFTYQIGLGNDVVFISDDGDKQGPFDVRQGEDEHSITTDDQEFTFVIDSNLIRKDQLTMWKTEEKDRVCTFTYSS